MSRNSTPQDIPARSPPRFVILILRTFCDHKVSRKWDVLLSLPSAPLTWPFRIAGFLPSRLIRLPYARVTRHMALPTSASTRIRNFYLEVGGPSTHRSAWNTLHTLPPLMFKRSFIFQAR